MGKRFGTGAGGNAAPERIYTSYKRGVGFAPEHWAALFECKDVGADGFFEGYASLFGEEDLGHDVVMPGAFTRSLKERGPGGIKLLFQHDPAEPLGLWHEIKEDGRGLFVRGQLLLDVARAREVHALMKAGALDGLSIGFHTKRAVREPKGNIRKLLEVDLWEISIVTFPMLSAARIGALSRRGALSPRDLEHRLTRDAGLSRKQARALIAGGYGAYRAGRDAGPDMHALMPPQLDGDLAGLIRRAAALFN